MAPKCFSKMMFDFLSPIKGDTGLLLLPLNKIGMPLKST